MRDLILRRAADDGRRALADPKLWKAPPRDPKEKGIPWQDPQRLIRYAVPNGEKHSYALALYKRYDLADAWRLASAGREGRNNPGSDRGSVAMDDIITYWAWRDPDGALAAAEAEPGESTRRDLIQQVAGVWAYLRPEAIDRAVRNQDNAVRHGWALDTAAAELERRRQGHPPRHHPTMVPAHGRPPVPDELARAADQFRRATNPKEAIRAVCWAITMRTRSRPDYEP